MEALKNNVSDIDYRIFKMHFIDEMAQREIKEALNINQPAVSRALARCKKFLRPYYMEHYANDGYQPQINERGAYNMGGR